MIVCDANALLYAYDARSALHEPCRKWLVLALNGTEQVGLPWQSLLAFVRIATNARAYVRPMTGAQACAVVSSWLERPQVCIPSPGERYWAILQAQMQAARVTGPMVSDAALAALALEQGATLCTTDRDFRRFDGLKLYDPTGATRG
jgi:toxin-antitoxin system PIN domain toxin